MSGAWGVMSVSREIGQHTVKLMRDNRLNPTTVEVEKIEVSEHLARTVNVHDASRLMSPRTFGQDTPNMIVERPSHPGRASHVLVTEAASAMGVTVDPGLPREQQQRHVGNAIVDVMADAISARVVDRASVAAAKLAPSATMAPMMSAPAPPPLLRPRALENAPSKLPPGVDPTRRFLHLAMGHMADKFQNATAKDHNWTLTGDKADDCRCKVDNMRTTPTFALNWPAHHPPSAGQLRSGRKLHVTPVVEAREEMVQGRSQWYEVLADFSAQDENELSVRAGEAVVSRRGGEDGWILVSRPVLSMVDESGYVPTSYIKISPSVASSSGAAPSPGGPGAPSSRPREWLVDAAREALEDDGGRRDAAEALAVVAARAGGGDGREAAEALAKGASRAGVVARRAPPDGIERARRRARRRRTAHASVLEDVLTRKEAEASFAPSLRGGASAATVALVRGVDETPAAAAARERAELEASLAETLAALGTAGGAARRAAPGRPPKRRTLHRSARPDVATWAGNKNIQDDFNMHVFARFQHILFTVEKELFERKRSVQKSAKTTLI